MAPPADDILGDETQQTLVKFESEWKGIMDEWDCLLAEMANGIKQWMAPMARDPLPHTANANGSDSDTILENVNGNGSGINGMCGDSRPHVSRVSAKQILNVGIMNYNESGAHPLAPKPISSSIDVLEHAYAHEAQRAYLDKNERKKKKKRENKNNNNNNIKVGMSVGVQTMHPHVVASAFKCERVRE